MRTLRSVLACSLALLPFALALPSFAQSADGACVLAGRVNLEGGWAPRMPGVQLLAADGRVIAGSGKQALAGVRQARLSQPALLSRCDGSGQLALGDETPGAKTPVPAIGPGLVAVESVAFPKLRRGGELVELKITVPAERVVMLTR